MASRFLRISIIVILSLMVSGIFIGTASCIFPDGLNGILWTTNAAGITEINQFGPGDSIYLKTNGKLGALPLKTNYTVYVFKGNVLQESAFGTPIPLSSFVMPIGFTPFNITTDDSGNIGSPWPTPIKIWEHATYGNFTVVLDLQGNYDLNAPYAFHGAGGVGDWSLYDLRDDICSGNHLPSFNVVPEPATIALVTLMFGAFASFLVVKRKVTLKK